MATLYRTLTGQSQKSQQADTPASSKPQLQRTTTTDPLTGSLNHMTPEQIEKLEKFKQELEKDGWWTPNGVNGKPSHDNGTLLRYLRARKFDINGAVGQFSDTEKWMKEQKVEELYEHFDVDFFERARTYYPQWTGRRDKRGIPIYVYEVKGLDSKHVSKYQKESESYKKSLPYHKNLDTPAKHLPLFALYHNLLNFVLPMCSALERPSPEIPVTNSTNIVDISGVGMTQFWNLKAHMQDASVLATAHYPETLDRIFIIGAPSFFPTVWSWVKRWFDPVTVSKIFILGKDEIKSTLESFMEPENIPKKYGGKLSWAWGDIPALGSEEKKALETDGQEGWVKGPCLFLEHERLTVGKENGKLRRSEKEIAEKKPVIYAADWTEDPVHPDRKSSTASTVRDTKATNGAAVAPAHAVPAAAAFEAAGERIQQKKAQPATPSTSNKNLNVHNSPSGDSQVHLPADQPAHPAITAEYISSDSKPQDKVDTTKHREPAPSIMSAPEIAPVSIPAPAPIPVSVSESNIVSVLPPPGLTQPGPLSKHAIEMNRQIARNLEGHSISTIPAEAGGALPHPELLVASDGSKGLAMEAEKLALSHENGANRPGMERFVTASQF